MQPIRPLTMTAAVGAILLVMGSAKSAEKPSFNCAKAETATEKSICSNDRLARLDRAIAAAFRQLKADMAVAEEMIAEEQTEFLKRRNACGADVPCLDRKMEARRQQLSLERGKSDPREAFIGRYRNKDGWMIVRRTLDEKYEILGQTVGQRGRWMCDIEGDISVAKNGHVIAEAGEEGDSHPVRLTMRGSSLRLTEDDDLDRRLAGYTCGANGYVEGDYRRVTRFK